MSNENEVKKQEESLKIKQLTDQLAQFSENSRVLEAQRNAANQAVDELMKANVGLKAALILRDDDLAKMKKMEEIKKVQDDAEAKKVSDAKKAADETEAKKTLENERLKLVNK